MFLQLFVPNVRALYGNAREVITLSGDCTYAGTYSACKYSNIVYVTETHIKALDQPTQRCNEDSSPSRINTSGCIAAFINREVGCNTNIIGTQYLKGLPCKTKSQLTALANISRVLEQADGNRVYDMTGCLSPCEKNKYQLSLGPLKTEMANQWLNDIPDELHLQFVILDSSYGEEEQYIIYDVESFIADIGGYMGLLLGSSLFSLYIALEASMKRFFRKPIMGKIDNT